MADSPASARVRAAAFARARRAPRSRLAPSSRPPRVARPARARAPGGAVRIATPASALSRSALAASPPPAPARSRSRRLVAHPRASPRDASARASPPSSSSFRPELVTFDLDDTLWPTASVVRAANEAFVAHCASRIPGFPDAAGVNDLMRLIRAERIELAERANVPHVPLSFAALRIAAAHRAATALGHPDADAVGVVARGYHVAWIPARGDAARELTFPGVVECLTAIREEHPGCVIGAITNGLGSAEGAGLGRFFDFEICAEALMDEEGILESDARKPAPLPFERAAAEARKLGFSGDASRWVHVGDDPRNDCFAAKTHAGARTVLVMDERAQPFGGKRPGKGGGAAGPGGYVGADSGEGVVEGTVDATVASVAELPGVLEAWAKE